MSDSENVTNPDSGEDAEAASTRWDPVKVLRDRAERAHRDCQESISELRESMDDAEVLAEFGIDLSEIEK